MYKHVFAKLYSIFKVKSVKIEENGRINCKQLKKIIYFVCYKQDSSKKFYSKTPLFTFVY